MARFSNPFSQFFSDSGRILPGAQLFFYVNGTTTPQATYEDAAFTVVNPNPVICGTNGRVPDIFMPDNLVYSITLTDTNGVQIDQADDITGSDSQVSSEDVLAALAANTDPVIINGSSATINADTTINGNQTITGTLGVTGALTASGGVDGVLGGVTPAAASVTTLDASGTLGVTGLSTLTGGVYLDASSTISTLTGNGQAAIAASTSVGLRMKGQGSVYDFLLENNAGDDVIQVPTGTQNLNLLGDATFSDDVSVGAFLRTATRQDVTIASGAITATSSWLRIDTESSAASDDLDTINGGTTGDIIIIQTFLSSRDVVLKTGTGNLVMIGGDVTLSQLSQRIVFQYDGSNWVKLSNLSS